MLIKNNISPSHDINLRLFMQFPLSRHWGDIITLVALGCHNPFLLGNTKKRLFGNKKRWLEDTKRREERKSLFLYENTALIFQNHLYFPICVNRKVFMCEWRNWMENGTVIWRSFRFNWNSMLNKIYFFLWIVINQIFNPISGYF